VFTAGSKQVALALLSTQTVQIRPDGTVRLPNAPTDPAVPPTDTLNLYAKKKAGKMYLVAQGPNGWGNELQTKLARNKVGLWAPSGNSNVVPGVFGLATLTATGTATARNVATANLFTRAQRLGYVGANTVGQAAGLRGIAQHTLGVPGAIPMGGFETIVRFGCSDAAIVAGARQFVGMQSAPAAPTNVEPSTLVNSIGVGHGAADTNLKLYFGGSAAQVPIDLGANFPANTLSVDLYELTLYAPLSVNNVVYYRVERLNTGNISEGTLTAATPGLQLPLNTTLLGLQSWRTNNATALSVALDYAGIAIEKDD
jgi:hypothetical protein